MKKGKYIDIYVMMACMSNKKRQSNLTHVNDLLIKACADPHSGKKKTAKSSLSFAVEESMSAYSNHQ